MLALPLTLSVAYKIFIGGESRLRVMTITYDSSYASYYGMFAPPDLETLEEGKGIASFINATTFFLSASSLHYSQELNFLTHAKTYDYNVLLLNNISIAILDFSHPSYLSTIQGLLASRDS